MNGPEYPQEITTAMVQVTMLGLDATDWAQIVSAIATVALAIWAVVTARANQAMVKEMREGRLAQKRPYVVVDLDYETRHPFVDVVVRNDGPRAAKNIKFDFSDALYNFDGLNVSSEVGYFKDGLDILAPGAEVPFTIGNRQHAVEIFKSRGLDKQGITVTVTYQLLDGEAPKDAWNLNPARFIGRQLVHPTPALDELEKLAVHLEKIAYVLALETRRRSWRRILNLRAYSGLQLCWPHCPALVTFPLDSGSYLSRLGYPSMP
jgi:hypothetical protein